MPVNLNGMDPRVVAALRKIQEQARARGIETNVISGVRSYQDQTELAANAAADRAGQPLPFPSRGHVTRAAAPGSSLHESGLAFDLQAADRSRQDELRSLASSAGLTVISNDPNHFQLEGGRPARPGTPQQANPSNPIYEGLVARGYSPAQAYALMGNMQQESNFSPGALNQGEGAYGLLQWRADRRTNLENFAASQGKSAGDLNTQLDFIRYEQTKGAEAGNASAFLASNDLGSANAALKRYIRYGDNSEGKRFANAQAFASGKGVPVGNGATSASTGGVWQAPEPPPASDDLGSILGSAAASTSTSKAPSTPAPPAMEPLPELDQTYALASDTPEVLGQRYQAGKAARKLSPLGELFTLPTIGPQTPVASRAPVRPSPYNMGIG